MCRSFGLFVDFFLRQIVRCYSKCWQTCVYAAWYIHRFISAARLTLHSQCVSICVDYSFMHKDSFTLIVHDIHFVCNTCVQTSFSLGVFLFASTFFCHWLFHRPFAQQTCIPIDSGFAGFGVRAQARGNIKQSKWNRFTSNHPYTYTNTPKNVMMKVKEKTIKCLLLAIVTIFAWRTCTRTVVCFDFLLSVSYCCFAKSAAGGEWTTFFHCAIVMKLFRQLYGANSRARVSMCVYVRTCTFRAFNIGFCILIIKIRIQIYLSTARTNVRFMLQQILVQRINVMIVVERCTAHTHTRARLRPKSFHFCCYLWATCLNAKTHSLIFFMVKALFSFYLYLCWHSLVLPVHWTIYKVIWELKTAPLVLPNKISLSSSAAAPSKASARPLHCTVLYV